MSKIEWTEKTWNPVVGCSKVSPGCTNCYAETMAKRLRAMGRPEYQDAINGNGKWTGRVTLVPERLEEPLKRKKPTTYFVNSMSDLFHPDVPFEFAEQVWLHMKWATQHTFQVLTKRPERMVEFMEWYSNRQCINPQDLDLPYPNLWLGVSVENQKAADERIPLLLQIPAAVRFVSAEPLLGAVDLERYLMDCDGCGNRGSVAYEIGYDEYMESLCNTACIKQGEGPTINWLIAGTESGPHRRPAELDWFRSLRDQCGAADVPFFLKQAEIDGELKKMPELDGRIWDQMPEVA